MYTFSQIIHQSYQEVPDSAALYLLHSRMPEQRISYRQLFESSAHYASMLSQAGVRTGEVVIIIHNHDPELIYAFFGAVLHGAVPSIMPYLTEKLAPEQYRSSLLSLFNITNPAAIITYPQFSKDVLQDEALTGALPTVLLTSPADSLEMPALSSLQGLATSPEDIVLLQHSSGTTGLQKGVALSHRAVFNQLESYSQEIRLHASDVIVSWLPLYHDMGLIAGFLLPILRRIPLVLLSPFDWVRAPYKLMQAISHYRGTLCWLPNFAYNFCAQKIRPRDLENVDLSCLRAVINCSEPMYWKSHQMFLERFQPYGFKPEALATSYAMAENVFAVTQGGIDSQISVDRIDPDALLISQIAQPSGDPARAVPMLSAGRPIANTQVRIISPAGQALPERVVGEIAIRSDCMLSGYFNRPDLTAKAFLDGWYRTGDLGYLAAGELYVTGRLKDLIIVGGKNIYPQDIENLAGEVPGVYPGRVVAFGILDEEAGTEEVVILAEVEPLDEATQFSLADDIRLHVNRASAIALRRVHLVERGWLIKTSSGKVARTANRSKFITEYGVDANV